MREQDIIFKAITELKSALPASVAVRTRGGDSSASPPVCILDWDSVRLSHEGGHKPLGGVDRDYSGRATGRELHRYNRMELDLTIRTYDESERDVWLSDVMDAFLPYEYDSSDFHEDTTEWEVGNPEPRSNPVVEPDWYEGGLTVRFKYVKRVSQSADPLTAVLDGGKGGVYTSDDF